MRIRSELQIAAVALVTVQVLTSFAAIGLLARMSPAVEHILDENVESVDAVKEMLAGLASADVDRVTAERRYARGLGRARANVTEDEERPLVELAGQAGGAALRGEPVARVEVVDALTGLSEVNRRSMIRTDAAAQRLGYAGAWTAAFLGVASFAIGVGVSRRLARRVEGPLAEIDAVLIAAGRGDIHRRANVTDAPEEVVRVAREVNTLLDQRQASCVDKATSASNVDRAALLALMAATPGAVVVIDGQGALLAANDAAMERLAGADGDRMRQSLRDAAHGQPGGNIALVLTLADSAATVCTFAAPDNFGA